MVLDLEAAELISGRREYHVSAGKAMSVAAVLQRIIAPPRWEARAVLSPCSPSLCNG